MKTITAIPFIFPSIFLGYIAMNSTRQSPYNAPDGLTEVLKDIGKKLPGYCMKSKEYPNCLLCDKNNLYFILKNELLTHPIVQSWNERKNGNKSPYGFYSRYDKPNPDDDFIDLDALMMNIVRDCIEWDRKNFEENNEYKRWTLKKFIKNIYYNIKFTLFRPKSLSVEPTNI